MDNTNTIRTKDSTDNLIPDGYKKSVIGVIPEEWEVKKIGDLIKFSGGSQPPLSTFIFEEKEGYIRLIQTRDYRTDKFKTYIRKEDANKTCDKDDIIIGRYGPPVFQIFKGLEGAYNVALMKAIPNEDKINKIYCYYFISQKGLQKYLEGLSQRSGGQTGVEIDLLNKYPIALPPLQEQNKIAEILSTWDEAISTTKKTIKKIKKRNKGLAQQLLTGKKRLSGFNDKWLETTIEKITKNFSNKNKGLIDARIYSVTNSNGFVYQSDHFSREVAGDDLTGYKIIRKNEFAYNPARINVGSIAFFTDDIGIISSLYVCFKTNDKVSNDFFIEWLKIEKTKHDIERYGEGGVRIYLWYDLFKKLKINLPSIEEQNAIVEVLATANQELKNFEIKLEALQLQKKGLMQQLLTGKIRVNL